MELIMDHYKKNDIECDLKDVILFLVRIIYYWINRYYIDVNCKN